MSLEMLLAQFDGLLQTPADVEKLNGAILQWAVEGRLDSQCTDDEPASTFLKQIFAKNVKKLPNVSAKEKTHPIPSGWEWERLGNVAFVGTGATPLRANPSFWEDGTIPWITSSATNSFFIAEASEFVTELALSETNLTLYPKRTLIVAMYGQGKTRGQVSELLIEATTNQACAAIILNGMSEETRAYIKLFFRKNYDDLRSLAEGGAQPNLNLGKIKRICIPFPPLAEQKRIVARVDELLGQTAVLAQQLTAIEEQRRGVNTAVLHQLTSAPTQTSEVLKTSEVFRAFDHLYVEPETIDALKQAILQLAVQGRLVPQDPKDEPASVLLERIATEKKRQVKDGLIPRPKKVPLISQDEIPFTVPATWRWVRLEELTSKIADIDHNMPKAVDVGGVKFLSAKDLLDDGTINFEQNVKHISEEDFIRLSRKVVPRRNDIIYSRIGARLGKARIVETDERFLVSYSCCVIRPIFLNNKYLNYYLDSGIVLEQAQVHARSIGVPDLGMQKIREFLISLPPIEEQTRIVEKVDDLFAMCDQLAGQVTAAETARLHLRDALLAAASLEERELRYPFGESMRSG